MRKWKYGRRATIAIAAAATVCVGVSVAYAEGVFDHRRLGNRLIGRQPDGSVLNSIGQFITPAGDTIEHSGRPLALAIRPDGHTAVDLSKSGAGLFTVLDLQTRKVLQQYNPPKGVGSGNVSMGGLLYSHDGSTLWAAQSNDLLRFQVAPDGTLSAPVQISLPGVAGRQPLPTDLAWAPDGKNILVVLNGNNTLGVLDPTTSQLTSQIAVGNAPLRVVVVSDHAFVSNEGGRKAVSTDFTNLSYGTPIVSDTRDGAASTGTVSEVDPVAGKEVRTYDVGLEPTALVAHGTDLLVANSNDDSISVIDTATGQLGQTFNVNPLPGAPFGSTPNSLAFLDASHLLVSLGHDNAVALYDYRGPHKAAGFSGLIPTGWYPGDVLVDRQLGRIVIAGQQGVGALGAPQTVNQGPGGQPATGHSVYADVGTVSLVSPPTAAQMRTYTGQVFSNNQWDNLGSQNNSKGSRQADPVAVPLKLGDPSKIKHVFLIVRENRTYDQVLGDDPRGNGDPSLTQFGKTVTPNTHALSTQFPLIDNLYSDGTNSAEGHNLLDGAFMSDYLQRNYANYTRSYQTGDALMYPKSGYLWDDAVQHKVAVRAWGENADVFAGPKGEPAQGSWSQWYHDSQVLEGKATGPLHAPVGFYRTGSDMPSLNKILQPEYPNFQTQIPDQYRADLFLNNLKSYEKSGNLPALNMMWVMTDHTSGTSPGLPTPQAAVADNDLATGRIIDGISHSKFWKDSAIFVVEDDSQNGLDHVDGHRNVALVASPYAKRGTVVHDYYSQLNITRTIEQILGLPPMNQLDLATKPMYDVFTDKPNFAPYNAVSNQVPLDTLNPAPAALSGPAKVWAQWASGQNYTTEDAVNMEQSNRLIWYSSNRFTKPYPGDSKVLLPTEVAKLRPATKAAPAGG